jgi:hypothetical protein
MAQQFHLQCQTRRKLYFIWSGLHATDIPTAHRFSGLDYVGTKLADCLGITAPRYEYYLNEAEKEQEEVRLIFFFLFC